MRTLQNRQKFAGGQTMVRIVREPRLQSANRFRAKCPAAIDKFFVQPGNFGHVGMGRNFAARWQHETNVILWILSKQLFQFK
jgi:hypothetical protein